MKRCLMVTGGPLDLSFGRRFLLGRTYDLVIAVDAGLAACEALGLCPDLLVGDFDTLGREHLLEYQERSGVRADVHRPEKDETDTELAFRDALEAGCVLVDMLGATGGRLDHELSNIQLLAQGRKKGLRVTIYDAFNKIFLADAELDLQVVFEREDLYGRYVSFLPVTETVKGITLTGFKYPLKEKDISILENPSLCISNEVLEEKAVLTFRSGLLLCVESRDRETGLV